MPVSFAPHVRPNSTARSMARFEYSELSTGTQMCLTMTPPRLHYSLARLGRRGPSPATACGSHGSPLSLASDGGAPAPRRPAARTALIFRSPRTAGPQPRDGLRLARLSSFARLGRRGPSPATACGSHGSHLSLASDGGAPAPRPPAARTTLTPAPNLTSPSPLARSRP